MAVQPDSTPEIWDLEDPSLPTTVATSYSGTELETWNMSSQSRPNTVSQFEDFRQPPRPPKELFDVCNGQRPPDTSSEAVGRPLSEEPLKERIQHVLTAARTAGFDSLDVMMLHYYTAIFDEDSASLLEIQHRSRRRGLRMLFLQLTHRASDWPPREAQAFEEIVLASIEQIVKREAEKHRECQVTASCSRPTPKVGQIPSVSLLRDKVSTHHCSDYPAVR